ncbi:MAG: diguanylate cyclase [Magnetospirillum sp.]|nr:diguanylate cyclase [Magnetospirillum sp.]
MARWSWVAAGAAAVAAYNITLAALSLTQREALLSAGVREAEVVAATVTAELESRLDTIDHTLSGIAEVLTAAPPAALTNEYVHRLLIRRHAVTPILENLLVVDAAGIAWASSSVRDMAPLDLSDRDYVIAHRLSVRDDMFIGKPVRSRMDGEWVIPVSRALESEFGGLKTVVVSLLSPERVDELIRAHRPSDGFAVLIRLPRGHVAACVGLADCSLEAEAEPWSEESSRGSGEEAAYLPGIHGPGAFVGGERYGVVTIAAIDRTRLLLPWQDSLPFFIGLSVAGTAGIVVGLSMLRRQIAARRWAMDDLAEANAVLEARVIERTRELADSEDRLRSFIRAARDAIVIIDEHGAISEFNPSAGELFGYRAEDVLGRNVNMLMPDGYAREHDGHLAMAGRAGERPAGRERQVAGRRADGSEFPIELTVGTRVIGGRTYHVGVIRDITERKANEDTLRRLANLDGLTGILNRRSFMEEGERLFAIAQRHARDLSVLMMDADHFKSVNDTHGHDVGDLVLKTLAATIRGCLRDTDVLGRLGGEEFAVVLPETGAAGTEVIATALVETVRAIEIPLAAGGTLRFTVSIGAASRNSDSAALGELLKAADGNLYVAKKAGRDRAVCGAAASM